MPLVDPVTMRRRRRRLNEVPKEQSVEEDDSKTQSASVPGRRRGVSPIFLILLAVVAIAGLFRPVSVRLYNYYIRRTYFPQTLMRYFIETPVHDISMTVPVYYECADFQFPDLEEAVDIQFRGRLRRKEYIALSYGVRLQKGEIEKYNAGEYGNDTLFIKMLLSDQNAIYVDGARNYAELYYTLQSIESNDLPFFVTQLLADYCFKEELQHYSEDRFMKLLYNNDTHFNLMHSDFIENPRTRTLMSDPPVNITLKFTLLGAEQFSWDIQEAFQDELQPYARRLSGLFNFTYLFEREALSNEVISEKSIDDKFPVELMDLPGLAQYYMNSLNDDPNLVHLVFYPFALANGTIENKTVDSRQIYSASENTFLKIGNWGSIYFSHSPKENPAHFTAEKLKDCMWSFSETIMDFLDFPNDNMAPILRVEMFERVMVINYLTCYSNLLFVIDMWVKENITSYIDGSTIDTVIYTLELRSQVLTLLNEGNSYDSLIMCQKMVSILRQKLFELGLQGRTSDLFAQYVLEAAAQEV
ncbi:DEKNAAC100101 [Brettanomyces naardenensis]|uniref:DEKNAAC100101 n=1 Tax=Brettanomyces naardenensis TaxID=13370 RepID=A0A448YFP7_BRENA|nr:DEKNAAC100101 [Brettanomyces naardenensis]